MRHWLLLAAFAVVAGCSAPAIGLEPDVSSDGSSKSHASSGDDEDDDSDNDLDESTSSTSSAEQAPSSVSTTSADGGTKGPVTCTESGAVQFGGHCYFALTSALSWDDAKTACAATGAHLATLTTQSEENIAEALDKTDERWIGLRRPTGSAVADASYVWVTSEPRSFADWVAAKSEPDGSCPTCSNNSQAECARVLTSGGWADDACSVKHSALCERE